MNKKILLVDDSSYMRGVLKKILKEAGFTDFLEASDGERALDAFQRERPGVVLLDIVMPNKNGVEVLRELRKLDAEARVVMVSAVGQDVIIQEALQAGAQAFIVKPFDAARVKETVQTVLAGGATP